MRNRVFGWIGVVWGGAILVWSLIKGGPQGPGGYAAGQMGGMIFAALLFVVGMYCLIKGGATRKDLGH
jgi:hypothetical protein